MAPGLDAVPDASVWAGLQPMERERREWVLDQIRRRVAEDGPRRAVASPERGRLFMPFAALDGYGELLGEVETAVGDSGAWRPPSVLMGPEGLDVKST